MYSFSPESIADMVIGTGQMLISESSLGTPKDYFHKERSNFPTMLLVPWYNCSSKTMWELWDGLAPKYNIIFPNISTLDWSNPQWISHIVGLIAESIIKNDVSKDLSIVWHSAWWIAAIHTASLIKKQGIAVNNITQIATPNNWLMPTFGFIPDIFLPQTINDVHSVQAGYSNIKNWHIAQRILCIISWSDGFVSPDDQWEKYIPNWLAGFKSDIVIPDIWHFGSIVWKTGQRVVECILDILNIKGN